MTKPNWDIFKAKFSNNLSDSFEYLCYLLFCHQYKKHYGVFRFKNQVAIETEVIKYENSFIGFQAKFYTQSLYNKKNILMKTITDAKKNYSDIDKLIIYTNQEWGQGKGKGNEPKGKIELEEYADKQGIELVWFTVSNFEVVCMDKDFLHISEYFFANDAPVLDLWKEKSDHTNNILEQIYSEILIDSQQFKLNRDIVIKEINKEVTLGNNDPIILSGNGGVGKTAVIKDLYELQKNEIPFYIFKANEFDVNRINDLFNNISINAFSDSHEKYSKKIIVIDSAEHILNFKNYDAIQEFLTVFKKEWKIIFTIRTNFLDDFQNRLLNTLNMECKDIPIANIEKDKLQAVSQEYNFKLPKDDKLLKLLCTPFYLNEYLKLNKKEENLKYSKFKKILWDTKIKKGNIKREKDFIRIIVEKVNHNSFYINTNDCQNTINELHKDGIIGEDDSKYFVNHDIYEEWALEKFIENTFYDSDNESDFLKNLGTSISMRRSFRSWMSEKLLSYDSDINKFINHMLFKEQHNFWHEEVLTSILLSNYSEKFFKKFKNKLLVNNQTLLKKLCLLIRLTCKDTLINMNHNSVVESKPKGNGWINIIKFVHENIQQIEDFNFILPVLYDWTLVNKEGDTNRYAGLIALKINTQLVFRLLTSQKPLFNTNMENLLYYILSNSSKEIQEEIDSLMIDIKDTLKDNISEQNKSTRRFINHYPSTNIYKPFLDFILLNLKEYFEIYKTHTQDILDLIELYYYENINTHWNKNDYDTRNLVDYASPYKLPIIPLLMSNFFTTANFIIRVTNNLTSNYSNTTHNSNINFVDHEERKLNVYMNDNTVTQDFNSGFWEVYRGTGSPLMPSLFQSIYMALEQYFLRYHKNSDSETLETCLNYLLDNSQSAPILGVVTSIVIAYPDRTFNIALRLFKTKEVFLYDAIRCINERGALYNYKINFKPINTIFVKERVLSCEDPHRKETLRSLFIKKQFDTNYKQILEDILDDHYNNTDKEKEAHLWDILISMDMRKKNIYKSEENENILILKTKKEELSNNTNTDDPSLTHYLNLEKKLQWAENKFHNQDNKTDCEYTSNSILLLQDIKKNIDSKDWYNVRFRSVIPAILLRDYNNTLEIQDKEDCVKIIYDHAIATLNIKHYSHTPIEESILSLQYIMDRGEELNLKQTLGKSFARCDDVGNWVIDLIIILWLLTSLD